MNKKFDNTSKYQSNYYLRKESKKECREEITQNKAHKLLTCPLRDKQKDRVELKSYIHEAIL